MNTTDVQSTFREMWETRPSRPREGRKVAGVALAVARRYDIDPTLVRIAFVVAAATGVGAALYIAGWFALPDERDGSRGSRVHPLWIVGLVIASATSVGGLFGNRGQWLVGLLIAGVLLYLLHQSRADRGLPGAAPTATTAGAGPAVSLRKGEPQDEAPGPVPPAWDPLGAAPFAWDLPEPSPVPGPAEPRPRRAPVTAVTLGLALLATAGTAAVLLMLGRFGVTSAPVLLGVALGVVGLGLLAGSFLHAGRGLIPFALVLSALTWGALSAPLDRIPSGDVGDVQVTPITVSQLQPDYRRGFGDVTLDLRKLDLSGSTADLPLSIETGLGDVTVRLPANTDVRFTADAGLGDIGFEQQQVSGDPSAHLTATSLGADSVASGRMLVLDVHAGAGDVAVRRG